MATSVRLHPDMEKRLDDLAAFTGRSKAFYIREMIESSIEDMEDYYRAVEISAKIRRGDEKVYSLEQVGRELGLAR